MDGENRGLLPQVEAGHWLCLVRSGTRFNARRLLDPSPYSDYGPLYTELYRCRYCGREFEEQPLRPVIKPHIDGSCTRSAHGAVDGYAQ